MTAHKKSKYTAQSGDWSDIHFAYQVAQLGTLSAAAAALDVHHSTVLRRIDALEKRLDTRLFHRHARGYTPTDAGKILLKVAAQTQDEFDKMLGQLRGVDEQLTGSLVITTVNSFASYITPVLAKFQEVHPGIRIEYVADPRIFRLEYGEAHVSIRPGVKPEDPDYVVQHLRKLPTTFYASREYIARYGSMRSPTDIKGHRFIYGTRVMSNVKHMSWMSTHIPEEQIYYRTSEFINFMYAAESALGIAPLNCWEGDKNLNLVPMFPPPKEWDSDIWLVTHRDIHRTPKVQALCQFLKDHLRD